MISSHLSAVFVILLGLDSDRAAAFSCHPSPPRSRSSFCDARPIASEDAPARCRFGPPASMKMASDSTGDSEDFAGKIRFLGSGEDAIVRPGVVLVAPKHEYDHFLRKSAVFVYAIGLDENESTIIRGVVLDHPTAFTIGEMSPNVMGRVSENQLFRGGYDGSDTAMLLHSVGGHTGPVGSEAMIGSSGIYEGGIVSVMESVDAGVVQPDQCKFFFNYMQFTDKEVDDMFAGAEDGDEWVSVEIPPEYVLDSDYYRGQLWSKLRNNIREIRQTP